MSVEMNMPTMKRPGGVTVVGFLIILAAVFNIFMGVWLIFASFGSNPEWTDAFGNTQTVSTFYLWFNGALMIFLGLIYFWLSKLTFLGSHTAHMLISLLAVLNIIFGLFALGRGGFVSIIINLIILLMINTAAAKTWFSQNI